MNTSKEMHAIAEHSELWTAGFSLMFIMLMQAAVWLQLQTRKLFWVQISLVAVSMIALNK
jgi:hypothetical protein